ncbi:N-formylglutamate amidohydrolase [Sphingomonas xinjiangensis]|uniref:N-formylglutamate amidohydrolase n=1 Tax=Sphingomonas xinjiangensis TaxID=643568 RepID=A0A840YNZ0_9SPHN|nr:N-formylglutamate amidohydrolase [Sphingomonas xinjiangensis]
MTSPPSFTRHGPLVPSSPLVLAVPHAGRDYPQALQSAIRVPVAALKTLEDRCADALALEAWRGETLFIAHRARAWIDLNRSEQDRDPKVEDGAGPAGAPLSDKLRSGLGLVPRRVGNSGDIWNRRLSSGEVASRIDEDHRPYHTALDHALETAHARYGIAILVDIHSMPPLRSSGEPPRLVIGDRFGKAAAARFTGRIEEAARGLGVPVAINTPYAGAHTLERHGRPSGNIHGVQLEFDRSFYLDATLDRPGPGFAAAARLLRAILDALLDEALPNAMAAE